MGHHDVDGTVVWNRVDRDGDAGFIYLMRGAESVLVSLVGKPPITELGRIWPCVNGELGAVRE